MDWEVGKEYVRNDGNKVRFLGRTNSTTAPLIFVQSLSTPEAETVLSYKEGGVYAHNSSEFRKYDIMPPFPTESEQKLIDKMKTLCSVRADAKDSDLLEVIRELRRK